MAVNFYLEKRLNTKGEAPIRCSISVQGERIVTTTGQCISPTLWDSHSQQVIISNNGKPVINSKGISARGINTHLKSIDQYFADLENTLYANHDKVDDLKAIYNDKFGKKKVKAKDEVKEVNSFYDVFDKFCDEMSVQKDWTKATQGKFKALKKHLLAFNSKLTFDDVNESLLSNYLIFLRDTLKFRNSTSAKQIGFLKWYLRWAAAHGYCSDAGFKTFTPKLKTSDKKVVFLDWQELQKVYKFKFPNFGDKIKLKDINGKPYEKVVSVGKETLEHVRDLFCFCAFTSLRYSDMANLRRSDIFEDYIQITTQKTSDMLKIELNKYAKAILEKYKDKTFPKNKALPQISNQRMNEYLKEMAEICGINKAETVTYFIGNKRHDEVHPKWALMGTHTGRRTFICNALMLGIPAQVVMKWTGHSDYKAMKPYIDITDTAKANAMKKFNK